MKYEGKEELSGGSVEERCKGDVETLTVYSKFKVTAVKLIPGGDLTPVASSEVSLGCYNVHLKSIHLKPQNHNVHESEKTVNLFAVIFSCIPLSSIQLESGLEA